MNEQFLPEQIVKDAIKKAMNRDISNLDHFKELIINDNSVLSKKEMNEWYYNAIDKLNGGDDLSEGFKTLSDFLYTLHQINTAEEFNGGFLDDAYLNPDDLNKVINLFFKEANEEVNNIATLYRLAENQKLGN